MDSNNSSAKGKRSWVNQLNYLKYKCDTCGRPIVSVDLEYIESDRSRQILAWAHTEHVASVHNVSPHYHDHASHQVEMLGYLMGMEDCSIVDNPYCPDGCLYDGGDSMGEAAVWHKGWHQAQVRLGRIPNETAGPAPESDGLDYLEAQRG